MNTLGLQAPFYNVSLDAQNLNDLTRYYEHVIRWNERLHLVAPCSPEEFATRHVLESLMLVNYLTRGASVADVGSGAGLPILPCLIVRPDLNATLVEASGKKAIFLIETLKLTGTEKRARVINERFEPLRPPDVGYVTCRALERFEKMLPQLIEWSPRPATLLLFGNKLLGNAIENLNLEVESVLMPDSRNRFLHVIHKN